MTKPWLAALWLILCTLLAIFNVCTIQIFDGFDWPFYAVALNALISVCGIGYYMHTDTNKPSSQGHLRRMVANTLFAAHSILVFPMLWLSLFTLSGEYHNALEVDATITSAKQDGFGYQSFIVLKDGERGTFDTHEFRCYRVLTILNGKVCIIDSRTLMHFGEFVQALKELGVRDAIYYDMGSGWNYSWYRSANGRPQTIIGMPWPFSHNWLTFRKGQA